MKPLQQDAAQASSEDAVLGLALRHDLPLSFLQQWDPTIGGWGTSAQNIYFHALILTALELTEELRQQQWIESECDMSTLPLEQIKQKMVGGLEVYYRDQKYTSFKGFTQPTLNEIKKYFASQTSRGSGRYVVHYVGRHQLLQLEDGIVMSQDEASRVPLAVSILELAKILQKQDQTIYIFDCSYAGLLVKTIQQLNQQPEYSVVAFGACQENQRLPYMQSCATSSCCAAQGRGSANRLIPTDIFSFSMQKPLEALFITYIYKQKITVFNTQNDGEGAPSSEQDAQLIENIRTFEEAIRAYKSLVESQTHVSSELQQIMRSICDNLAWISMSPESFHKYCKVESQTPKLIRNFFVAQRVMHVFGCDVCSSLEIADQSQNSLWSSFDACLTQLFPASNAFGSVCQSLPLASSGQRPTDSGDNQTPQDSVPISRETSVTSGLNMYSMTGQVGMHSCASLASLTPSMKQGSCTSVCQFAFNREQISSFELQVNLLRPDAPTPQNLSIVTQLLSYSGFRLQVLSLLCKFLDAQPGKATVLARLGFANQLYKLLYGLRKDFQSQKSISDPQCAQACRYIAFLLLKLLSSEGETYRLLAQARANTHYPEKDFLQKIYLFQIKNEALSVDDRRLYLQLLVTIAAPLPKKALKKLNSIDFQQFVEQGEKYLIQQNAIPIAKALSQSVDPGTRIWAGFWMAQLMQRFIQLQALSMNHSNNASFTAITQQQAPSVGVNIAAFLPTQQNVRKTKLNKDSQLSVALQQKLNSQETEKFISDTTLFYAQQLAKDALPEVRATAAYIIKSCTIGPSELPGIQTETKSTQAQDLIQNWLDLVVYETLLARTTDPSSLVRVEVAGAVLSQIYVHMESCVTLIHQQMKTQYIDKVFKRNISVHTAKDAELLMDALQVLSRDPAQAIYIPCMKTLENIRALAAVRLATCTKLEPGFYTAFREGVDKDKDWPSNWELKHLREHPLCIRDMRFEELLKELKGDHSVHSEIVAKSYDDYSSLKAQPIQLGFSMTDTQARPNALRNQAGAVESDGTPAGPDRPALPLFDMNAVSSCEAQEPDAAVVADGFQQLITLVQQHNEKKSSPIPMAQDSTDAIGQALPQMREFAHQIPEIPIAEKVLENDFLFDGVNDDEASDERLPVLQEFPLANLQGGGSGEKGASSVNKELSFCSDKALEGLDPLDQSRYKFLLQKLQFQRDFDAMILQIAQSMYGNRIAITIESFKSTLPALISMSIREQAVASNTVMLAQQAACSAHRTVMGCFQHAQIRCSHPGVLGQRQFDLRCACGAPCRYYEFLQSLEIPVEPASSCLSLTTQQRQDMTADGEMKRVDSQDSLFSTLLRKAFTKEPRDPRLQWLYKKVTTAQEAPSQSAQKQASPRGILIRSEQMAALPTFGDAALGQRQRRKLWPDSPIECEAYIFALPIAGVSDVLQDDIVLSLNKTLPDSALKFKNMVQPHFELIRWQDALRALRTAQTTESDNILVDGIIYKQYQLPYDHQVVQQVFQSTLKLIRVFDQSLNNADVTNLQLSVESINALGIIDQSCLLCRRLAIRRTLLEKITKHPSVMREEPGKQFVYYPTREYAPLIMLEPKNKFKSLVGSDADRPLGNPLQYQVLLLQQIRALALPFRNPDVLCSCSKDADFSHAQITRSLYRIVYESRCEDPFQNHIGIGYYDPMTSDSSPASRCCSVINMAQLDSESTVSQLEYRAVTDFIRSVSTGIIAHAATQPPLMAKAAVGAWQTSQSPQSLRSGKAVQPYVPDFTVDEYEQARTQKSCGLYGDQIKGQLQEQFRARDLIVEAESVSAHQRPGEAQLAMQATFQLPGTPKVGEFHPWLPYFATAIPDHGVLIFNTEKQILAGHLDLDSLCDAQASLWGRKLTQHYHTELSQMGSACRPMAEVMRENARSPQNVYYGHLVDRESESQECVVCQGIKEQNMNEKDAQLGFEPDFVDQRSRRVLDSTTRYLQNQTDGLASFFDQNAQIGQSYSKYIRRGVPQDDVEDIAFLNTTTPWQLLALSTQSCTLRVFSNPFDLGIHRQVMSMRVFDPITMRFQGDALGKLQQITGVNYSVFDQPGYGWCPQTTVADIIPVFDALRRVAYPTGGAEYGDYSQLMRSELLKTYLDSRLASCVNELQDQTPLERAEFAPGKFLTAFSKKHAVCALGKELKVIDLERETVILEQSERLQSTLDLSATLTAVSAAGNVVALGDVNGNVQIFDIRAKMNAAKHEGYKFDAAVSQIAIQADGSTLSAALQNGTILRQQGDKTTGCFKPTDPGLQFVGVNGAAHCATRGQITIYDMVSGRGITQRTDRFNGAAWKPTFECGALWSEDFVRLFGPHSK